MEKSSKNNFEQQWKQKFEKTTLPPPADLWNRIEADLDKKTQRKPFFLLWGVPAYVVSGIAATLILAIGGWFLLSQSETNVANDRVSQQKNEQLPEVTSTPEPESIQNGSKVDANPESETYNVVAESNKAAGVTSQVKSAFPNLAKRVGLLTDSRQSEVQFVATEQGTAVFEAVDESSMTQTRLINVLSKITGRSYDEYPVRYILKRNKLAYVEPVSETTEPVKSGRTSWIGLISGLSPFKPNFQGGNLNQLASTNVNAYSSNDANFNIQRNPSGANGAQGPQGSQTPAEPGLENGFAIPTGNLVQQFTNGRAFNLGIQAGKQLTKRLALESGMRYIQGNSPVNTNVYTLNGETGEINAFVQDYITQDRTLSNAVVAPLETLNNSYEYLSIPVQLAYGVPLLNRLNVEIIGGISADMFLQNTLQSETTDFASLTSSNSAFRTLGVSGLGGIRLNYLLDNRWELTVGSAFQQALVSNFESGTSAKLRPQMLGVNYGVNYHF